MLVHIVKKSIEKKVFVNGTKFFEIDKKYCFDCLMSTKNDKTYYYHYGSVMSIIGKAPKLILGYESSDMNFGSYGKAYA